MPAQIKDLIVRIATDPEPPDPGPEVQMICPETQVGLLRPTESQWLQKARSPVLHQTLLRYWHTTQVEVDTFNQDLVH